MGQFRKVVRQRRIIQGQGVKDTIVEYGRNGVRYLKKQSINGARKLVPYAVRGASSLSRSGIDKLADALHSKTRISAPGLTQAARDASDSLMHAMGDRLEDKLRAKMGGSGRPGRHLLLREINHAMGKSRR